jgi:hypothetical protein
MSDELVRKPSVEEVARALRILDAVLPPSTVGSSIATPVHSII